MYNNFINWLTLKISKINPIIFVAIVLQIIIIIVIITAAVNIFSSKTGTFNSTNTNQLSISNINQQIPNLPQSSYEEITFSIYDAAWLNRSSDKDLPTTLTANIRDNSTTRQYFESIDVHQTNFIIDIPELQQSYQVNHLWSKDSNNPNIPIKYKTLVYCPTDSQKVYPEQNTCTDRFAGTASQIIQSLPH